MSKYWNNQSVFYRMLSKTLDLMENLFTDDPCKQVYEIFDHAVLENYPEFKKYLAINAQIVHYELAVMKVIHGYLF